MYVYLFTCLCIVDWLLVFTRFQNVVKHFANNCHFNYLVYSSILRTISIAFGSNKLISLNPFSNVVYASYFIGILCVRTPGTF